MSALLDSPFMQNMLSNPDTVRAMMMANPQTRQVGDRPWIGCGAWIDHGCAGLDDGKQP